MLSPSSFVAAAAAAAAAPTLSPREVENAYFDFWRIPTFHF
jgi:hypothetical protein